MAKRTGVTAPDGFVAGGLHCGIKKDGAPDLAMIVSLTPATACGLFTTNKVKGAPVILSRARLRRGRARAIVANSGNANTLTRTGLEDAERMAGATAKVIGCHPRDVLVASTGVIGESLPIEKIERGIARLGKSLSRSGGSSSARAIMTTDLVKKEGAARVVIAGKQVTVGACAKGSGMIHPNMATMLAFVTTDSAISRKALKDLVKRVNDVSFARLTVDGDTSTSDMFIVMANGASGAPLIEKPSGKRYSALVDAVSGICEELARKMARDGEGATKFVTIKVAGALTQKGARKIAMAIARSSLVKTALFGEDANWGRILAAGGYSGAPFDVDKTSLEICGRAVFIKGAVAPAGWEKPVSARLKGKNIDINIDLGLGKATALVWTCDLSHDYIRINAEYRS